MVQQSLRFVILLIIHIGLNDVCSYNINRYGHVVFGVGDGIVNAHNMAHYHKSISDYSIDECVSSSGAIDERDDDAKIKTV